MNWNNTKLVFRRELCDQWRDRRTLFTIVVMPLVLYPLMGMALLQTAQFMRQEPAKVVVVNNDTIQKDSLSSVDAELTSSLVAGIESQAIECVDLPDLDSQMRALLEEIRGTEASYAASDEVAPAQLAAIQRLMRAYGVDVIVSVIDSDEERHGKALGSICLFVNSASERSAMAGGHIEQLIQRWHNDLLKSRLATLENSESLLATYAVSSRDVASPAKRGASLWAKLLPFIVLVWALTGAFYPAIDVCAGEKERGTLETLLSSPAKRSEIVAGKLLTVATFSIATALLNLLSMALTGLLVIGQLSSVTGSPLAASMGFPPLTAILWLILGLIPISALFSALALALAAFARSSKEGQYYLIPLLMSLLPLMMLSMLPSAKLDLGTSLIPVTGLTLLLRNLIIGEYAVAAQFAGPVLAITLVCCWLAMRWAIFQFNNESVLFRSGEQFGVGIWLKHLVRDRGLTPTIGEAILCGVMILVIKFFVGMAGSLPTTFGGFAKLVLIGQIATIALPAALFALFLTRSPRLSLKLVAPRWSSLPAFVLMAILLHPAMMAVAHLVMQIYPPSAGLQNMESAISAIFGSAPSLWAIILVVAIVPAFCEELAFRGFILSGLQRLKSDWAAIVLSSLLFGAAHGILQQSILAALVGTILGIIAVKTGSLLPCVLYHATHNAIPVLMSAVSTQAVEHTYMGWVLEVSATNGGIQYTVLATIGMPVVGAAILIWLWRSADLPERGHRLFHAATPSAV